MHVTKDMFLASFLLYSGYEFSYEKNGREETVFTFQDGENLPVLKDTVEDFINKRCLVEPLRYSQELKRIKNMIYGV